jgi:multiple sugar transport system ATP-binding protein
VGRAGPFKFGVRPEDIVLARQAADDCALPATVSLLEPLGAETLVTLSIGAAEVIARFPAAFRRAPGDKLAVYVNPGRTHLFDAATGAALQ